MVSLPPMFTPTHGILTPKPKLMICPKKMLVKKSRLFLSIIAFVLTLFLMHIFGVFLYVMQIDFDRLFTYPLELPNLPAILNDYRQLHDSGESYDRSIEIVTSKYEVAPINRYDVRILNSNPTKCHTIQNNRTVEKNPIRLTIIVKSALSNRHRRNAIRQSWGMDQIISGKQVRTVYSLGSCEKLTPIQLEQLELNSRLDREQSPIRLDRPKSLRERCQQVIDEEIHSYRDVIQYDFSDTYFNNSIKTMMGIRWAVQNCAHSQFYMLVDDDFYVSVPNLLGYLDKLTQNSSAADPFYGGYTFRSATPCRHQTSKWYVDLAEYPFSRWPVYVTAGLVILSNRALLDFNFASLYTRHFRFDDIYLSILALKCGFTPVHMENVHFYRKNFDPKHPKEFQKVIGSHGFGDPVEMLHVWNQNHMLGHA